MEAIITFLITLAIVVVVGYLLWILIDLVGGLLPNSRFKPTLITILQILFIIGAIWFILTKFPGP